MLRNVRDNVVSHSTGSLLRHCARVRAILARKGWAQDEIEDLVQEAFLRLQSYSQRGGQVREPEGFLVATAVRLGINARRDAHRHMYMSGDVADLAHLVDTNPLPEDVVAAEQALGRMRRTLDAVNHRTRQIFFLHRLDGLSHAQIAQRMGISVSAIEKHIAAAALILTASYQRQ